MATLSPPFPVFLWFEGEDAKGDLGEKATPGRAQSGEPAPIRCAHCEAVVSEASALFLIDSDRVTRVFANPHGHLHEIATVRWARGLRMAGPATEEFTWYAGYAWEIANCQACDSHIGWQFAAVAEVEPSIFFALRRNQVTGLP